ncbi:Rieske 2Fe-2S domain-containing protein [Tropicibacter sp. R16_0]|uniref:aromatic ring-hydroxylating oxygenase subunit alpha n=1 Tax=Tropicibacter sp. R16_0 TaxID=2821102 RepID=UPI001ADC8C3A|nr:SRPBCC family protein [Tropicibacter sp. R16_0]MBO9449252.1 Rieske 2Fe-2S domain-containing protein [Tropicibacter sp. R16_0]
MERSEEIGLIREIIGLAEQKSAYLDDTISHSPISRYASPERFAREEAALFRRKPVVAAHSGELDGPSSFLTRSVMGFPVLLVRDADGQARAFLNVCRHRGATLEREGAGCKRVFTCPYHGWSWTNQGDLRAVPQEKQGFPDLPRAERGLRRLPVAEAHGFIWIIANPEMNEPLNIDDWLGPIADDFRWLDLANHKIAIENTIEVKANWKVLVEGGIEAYHFRVAHANTIAPHFPDNLSTYRCFGPHMRSVLPRTSMTTLTDTPEEKWSIRADANVLYTLMPTTQLLVQQDHVAWINAQPRSEGHTTLRIVTLAPADKIEGDEMQAHWKLNQKITMATLAEDFELGEEIQSGFASRGNPSHLFGRFEGALNRFNLAVEELIAG